MKRITTGKALIATAIAMAATTLFGTEPKKGPSDRMRPMTEEEREAMLIKTGGPIMTPEEGQWISVINCQNIIHAENVAEEVAYLRKVFKVPIHEEVSANASSLAEAAAAAKAALANGAGLAVAIADVADAPSLALAPSDQFGIVNVAPLADKEKQLTRERFHKELLRCMAYGFGVGNSSGRGSVLKPIASIAELDALDGRNLGPDALGAILRLTHDRGMKQMRQVPYRRAVEEGWAPAPTNDYQRAVWDEVKGKAATNEAAKAEGPAQ